MATSTSEAQSAYFPIRVVSSETGVNAITLRAWERRYGLITPKRTAKGHRLYTEDDIRLVKQVVTLLDRGIPISQAKAMLDHGDLETNIEVSPTVNEDIPNSWNAYRDQLDIAVQRFDDEALNRIFEELAKFFPVDISLRQLFIPFLELLREDNKTALSYSYQQFYKGFLCARLACRLAEPANRSPDAKLLVASVTPLSSIDLLMLANLLKPLGVHPVYLQGPLGCSDIATLLTQHNWQGAILHLPKSPAPVLLQQLQTCAVETGLPIFTMGASADQGASLRRHGVIAMVDDIQTSTSIIRDMLLGAIA